MYDRRSPTLPPVATLLAASLLVLSWPIRGETSERYARVVIVEPETRATIQDKSGAVHVRLVVEPPLRAGDQIRVRLDDRVLRVAWSNPSFALEDVNRGQHTMTALVTDARGVILAESTPVQFHVQPATMSSSGPLRGGGR